ncbi:MAG: antibiotic biosynthesis monooxygenase [Anaerolineae bacterium]|nr:antibiotic biosynthesis monooxygenase [Anaerolineae bacterium]
MIARIWKAVADAERVKDYVAHFEKNVFPELRQIMGFQGAYVMEKVLDDGVEIQVMSLWESMDAIRQFAGEQVDQAVVEPEAQAVLRSFDKTVSHHEVLVKH